MSQQWSPPYNSHFYAMGSNITYLPETKLMSSFLLYILKYQKSDKLVKNSLYEKRLNRNLQRKV